MRVIERTVQIAGSKVCLRVSSTGPWLSLSSAEINLFRGNLQCKEVVLAGFENNKYGSWLSPFAPSCSKSDVVSLTRRLSFVQESSTLSDEFKMPRFNEIFRDPAVPEQESSSAFAFRPSGLIYVDKLGDRIDSSTESFAAIQHVGLIEEIKSRKLCKQQLLNQKCRYGDSGWYALSLDAKANGSAIAKSGGWNGYFIVFMPKSFPTQH